MSVHAGRIQEVLLVAALIVADFTTADTRLPACSCADGIPAFFVIAVFGAYFVVLVHEGVVEESEVQCHQVVAGNDGCISLIAGIDGDSPRNVLQNRIDMLQEFRLIGFRREVDAEIQGCSVNVILRPMAETHFNESQSLVVLVSFGKVGIEHFGEALQLGIAPVGIVGRTVAAGIRRVGLVVVAAVFDVLRYGSSSFFGAWDVVAVGVFISEAGNELMAAAGNIVEQVVEPRPVVLDAAVAVAAFHHQAGQTVGILQRDGASVSAVPGLSLSRPEHQARHGLRVGNRTVQFNCSPYLRLHSCCT